MSEPYRLQIPTLVFFLLLPTLIPPWFCWCYLLFLWYHTLFLFAHMLVYDMPHLIFHHFCLLAITRFLIAAVVNFSLSIGTSPLLKFTSLFSFHWWCYWLQLYQYINTTAILCCFNCHYLFPLHCSNTLPILSVCLIPSFIDCSLLWLRCFLSLLFWKLFVLLDALADRYAVFHTICLLFSFDIHCATISAVYLLKLILFFLLLFLIVAF